MSQTFEIQLPKLAESTNFWNRLPSGIDKRLKFRLSEIDWLTNDGH